MQTILIANSKGGSGKSTIATNLASYFATRGLKTALMDYDPQGSSLHWLKVRPDTPNPIHGANAAMAKKGTLRSWQMKLPHDTEILIIDAPAGVTGIILQEMCRRADRIVIPVAPSSIDIHATAGFIKDLMLVGKVRLNHTKMAVVANRVHRNLPLYEPLQRFLISLNIPFVTKLTNSRQYIYAVEQGLGIFDLHPDEVRTERAEMKRLIKWLEQPSNSSIPSSAATMLLARNTNTNLFPQ